MVQRESLNVMDYPKTEHGFYHLLPDGWRRRDFEPFPQLRLETWAYEMEQPTEDAKERVRLVRTWKRPGTPNDKLNAMHIWFGEPVQPTVCRNVTLGCEV